MRTKENDIIGLVILDILTEREHRALKLMLETEENYQVFLSKLLNILIGKDKSMLLGHYLELHNIYGKEINFNTQTNSIIEDIAELAFKGYSSEITLWLNENQNIVYLEHLSFLEDVRSEIEKKERITIKNRLKLLSEMKDFDLTEDEIREGIILYERNRLRKHFAQLSAQEKSVTKVNTSNSPNRLKYASILLLIGVSSIILAYSIPQVRNFIKKELKELFQKEEPPAKKESDTVIAPKEVASDTLVNNIDTTINNATNVQTEDVPVTEEKKVKETVIAPIKTTIVLEAFVSNKDANSADYWNYFRKHKLDNIEGLWKWTCTKRTHINLVLADTLPLFCSIREIEDKKYEIAFFQENGNRVHPSYVSIITKKINNNKYELTQYKNEKHPIIKNIYLSDEGELKFNAYFILSDFQNFAGKVKKGEWSEYTVIGKKK